MIIEKQTILEKISSEDIMKRYFPEPIKAKKIYRNPFRIDKSPGCTFKNHPDKGLIFIDWSKSRSYDCFDICKEVNKLKNFKEIMLRIDEDFGLNLAPKSFKIIPPTSISKIIHQTKVINLLPEKNETSQRKFIIRPRIKSWSSELSYWNSYGIDKDVLELFNVKSCSSVVLGGDENSNGKLWVATKDNPIFLYTQPEGFQVYRPNAKKENGRFSQNLPVGYLMGLEQIPKRGKILFITKSLKDVMVLFQLGIPAVAPIGESGYIDPKLLEDLQDRFEKIVVFFDNDESGYKGAAYLQKQYGFYLFAIPRKLNIKDSGEFVKEKGYLELSKLLKQYGAEYIFEKN